MSKLSNMTAVVVAAIAFALSVCPIAAFAATDSAQAANLSAGIVASDSTYLSAQSEADSEEELRFDMENVYMASETEFPVKVYYYDPDLGKKVYLSEDEFEASYTYCVGPYEDELGEVTGLSVEGEYSVNVALNIDVEGAAYLNEDEEGLCDADVYVYPQNDLRFARVDIRNATYKGKAIKPKMEVRDPFGTPLEKDVDYTVKYIPGVCDDFKYGQSYEAKSYYGSYGEYGFVYNEAVDLPKQAGPYLVIIEAVENGKYVGETTATFQVAKIKNTMVAKKKSSVLNVKYSKLKKKNQTIKKSKAFKISKAKGEVTFRKANKAGGKKIVVSKSGKITVKKGLKKGTYKVKVYIKASGTTNYKPFTKVVFLKIRVK